MNLLKQAGGGLRVMPGNKSLAPLPEQGGAEALFGATRALLADLGA